LIRFTAGPFHRADLPLTIPGLVINHSCRALSLQYGGALFAEKGAFLDVQRCNFTANEA
jgi:hypothetical protein